MEYLRDNHYDFYYSYRPTIQSTSARVGGALTVTSSTVNISSSRFESNTVTVGGAIFSQLGSSMTISNSTFINNSAMGGRAYRDNRCHGGALFIDRGCTVTAHNSTFIDNTAGYGGGAISLFQGTFIDSTHNVYSSSGVSRISCRRVLDSLRAKRAQKFLQTHPFLRTTPINFKPSRPFFGGHY